MVQVTEAPTDREQWLAERRQRIGATDVSAIMGVNPYSTAYDVWLDKTGKLEPWDGNDATSIGNILEPSILDEAERRWGELNRQVVVKDIHSPVAATLDGWNPKTWEVVEVKSPKPKTS